MNANVLHYEHGSVDTLRRRNDLAAVLGNLGVSFSDGSLERFHMIQQERYATRSARGFYVSKVLGVSLIVSLVLLCETIISYTFGNVSHHTVWKDFILYSTLVFVSLCGMLGANSIYQDYRGPFQWVSYSFDEGSKYVSLWWRQILGEVLRKCAGVKLTVTKCYTLGSPYHISTVLTLSQSKETYYIVI